MKSKFTTSFILIICIAVFSKQTFAQTKPKTVKKAVPAAVKAPIATPQEIEEGKALILKSDCIACHHLENKLVGPPYNTVSEKYPLSQANITKLSQKIISGGSGVWGTVPMPPHTALSTADAGKMVKYILSLSLKSQL